MEELRDVMRLIDENAVKLPEGDYLKICNSLQKLFRSREAIEMSPIFDYENFNFYLETENDTALDYFHDHYYTKSLEYDEEFLEIQLRYLQEQYESYRPFKRMTKRIRTDAIKHYCWMHNIYLERYNPEYLKKHHDEHGYDLGERELTFEDNLQFMYKSYFRIANQYRELYQEAIQNKMEKIRGWIANLQDM